MAGVDAVAYDAAAGAVFTGDKAGVVRQFDASRPGSAPVASWTVRACGRAGGARRRG